MDKVKHSLKEQYCIPCQGGVSPLDSGEINDFLVQLNNDWQINEKGHLYKKYLFKDFITAIKFVNLVTAVAEKEGHHPDLSIGWGYCGIEMWTHKVNGLTPSDFYMAAKIDEEFSDNFV